MTKKLAVSRPGCKPGVGLDIGTMNIVAARRDDDGKVNNVRIRDAFIDLDMEAKRSLKMSKVDYIEKGETLIVIGDSALTMANLFKRDARRPLNRGVISAGEIDAQEVLGLLIKSVLEDPVVENEHCFYSVPAAPIDDLGQDIIFHTGVFKKILTEQGYTAHPINEAQAIIYSQCAEDNFSGLAVSFGAGMINIALSYQANLAMSFSVARGGDWVDAQSAKAIGKTSSQMCAVKEKGFDLRKPDTREQQALVFYVSALIEYALQNIAAQFKKVRNDVTLPEPIPFVISGGTSKAQGFLEVFKDQFEAVKKKGFPIEVSEVRQATDPMTAVAEGLLVLAMEEHEGE
jgi:cell division ATPase FtsA